MFIFTLTIIIIYSFFILVYSTGWYRLKTFKSGKQEHDVKISVLIPMRNEENKITLLLNDIINQSYPDNLFEVIIIDDNSSDNSLAVVEEFVIKHPDLKISLLHIENTDHYKAYKKFAITMAVEKAMGDLIITTDADCRVGVDWLKIVASYYQENNFKMIVGPVKYGKEENIFEKAQSLEFISLIGITAGAVKIGWPLMCNGANLAYDKKTFFEVKGYEKDTFSSGDDLFLLMKIRRRFGAHSIGFLKNRNAFVETHAQKNVKSFINQRKRWASKNKAFHLKIVAVAFVVFMTNFMILFNLICALCNTSNLKYFVLFIVIKFLVDLPLVIGISAYIRRLSLLKIMLPLVLFYPFYIVFTGIIGIFGNYEWKGRKIRK